MPQIGDRVHVRPRPGHQVQRGDGLYGQFIPDEGQECTYDEFLHRRFEEGSLHVEGVHYGFKEVLAPLVDEHGQPVNPPPGDLAHDLAHPNEINRAEEHA